MRAKCIKIMQVFDLDSADLFSTCMILEIFPHYQGPTIWLTYAAIAIFFSKKLEVCTPKGPRYYVFQNW